VEKEIIVHHLTSMASSMTSFHSSKESSLCGVSMGAWVWNEMRGGSVGCGIKWGGSSLKCGMKWGGGCVECGMKWGGGSSECKMKWGGGSAEW
jgi:hypothetical protein